MTEHHAPFRLLADLVHVGAAVGAVAALVGIPSHGMGARFLLVLLALMVPCARRGVPAPLDFAFGAALSVALWASTTGWYGMTPVVWLVHAMTTGVTAVVLYLAFVVMRVLTEPDGRLARARVVARTVLIGLVVGDAWEAYRWLESVALPVTGRHTAMTLAVHLTVAVAGALVACLLLAALRRPARTSSTVTRFPSEWATACGRPSDLPLWQIVDR